MECSFNSRNIIKTMTTAVYMNGLTIAYWYSWWSPYVSAWEQVKEKEPYFPDPVPHSRQLAVKVCSLKVGQECGLYSRIKRWNWVIRPRFKCFILFLSAQTLNVLSLKVTWSEVCFSTLARIKDKCSTLWLCFPQHSHCKMKASKELINNFYFYFRSLSFPVDKVLFCTQ